MFFFLATALGGLFLYKFVSDEDAMHRAALNLAKTEKEEKIRDAVITPKVQKALDAIMYTLNADRVFVIELHNGKRNNTGLPFRYFDISYETTNEDSKAVKIGMQYQNVPTTLYRYPTYLLDKKILIEPIEEVKKIDSDLGKQMEGNGAKYFAIISLSSNGTPVGYLGVTWCDMDNVPEKSVIAEKLRSYDKVLSQLLDLRIQMIL